MAVRWEKAPRTPEQRLLKAVRSGPVLRSIANVSLWLALYQERHEDTLFGWVAERVAGALDSLSYRIFLLPRLRFK